MTEDNLNDIEQEINETESLEDALKEVVSVMEAAKRPVSETAQEQNDKYMRLYADFENYRKRVNRDKEDLIKYGNESLLYELLPVIDSLELALRHSSETANAGLVQGVEMTLKELLRTIEKFGVTRIDAVNKVFDPAVHHAMSQVEREDIDEKMVAEEMRSGYHYRDKVLRPSLVMVSVKPQKNIEASATGEAVSHDDTEIKINRIIEEE